MSSNMHDILGILNGSKIKQQCRGDYVPGGGPPSLPSQRHSFRSFLYMVTMYPRL